MNKVYVLIVAFSLFAMMAILGCGGSNGTTNTSGFRKYDGTYESYAIQARDNGGAYVAAMIFTVSNGQITGDSTLLYYSSFMDEEPDVVRTDTITGSIENYWEGGSDYLHLNFCGNRGGGYGGGEEGTFLDVSIYKLKEWIMSEIAFSNLNDDEFRYDWGFGMYLSSEGYKPSGEPSRKSPTEIKELLKRSHPQS